MQEPVFYSFFHLNILVMICVRYIFSSLILCLCAINISPMFLTNEQNCTNKYFTAITKQFESHGLFDTKLLNRVITVIHIQSC
jgi:hypothetical protein